MNTPATLAALALALAPASTDENPTPPPAIEVLADITVAEDHPMDNYDRDTFAPTGWIDTTGNGCTTREDVLARDLDNETLQIDGCTVEYGQTIGAYSGEPIEHVQGASEVDIEHVVAVGQAWRNGAHTWDETTRQTFYQDQENLIAVSAPENQTKGAKDATEYMPPNQGTYCEYAAATVYIKGKYDLAMNPAEHEFIADLLTDPECTDTPAAPAQAIYTSDWQSQPSTSQPPNAAPALADQPSQLNIWVTVITAGIALILILSPKARKFTFRTIKRYTRRAFRKGLRAITK